MKWVKRVNETNSIDRLAGSGRPKIFFEAEKEAIVEYFNLNPFSKTSEIAAEYNVDPKTISAMLKNSGLQHRVPAQKPILTNAHRAARVLFAENYLNMDWENVIFTDEKVFKSDHHAKFHLYRPNNMRYNEKYVQRTRVSGQVSCGIWGWMSAGGVGELCEISSHMNSREYLEILNEVMIPSVNIVYPDEFPITFMQDNSAVHKSRETMNWIHQNIEIRTIPWPAYSPDLNPIENVWGYMVKDWMPLYPRTREVVLEHVNKKWEELRGNPHFCQQLVASLPNRLREVIDNDGYWTHY